MNAAETFLDGGTDFERPLDEAIQLMNAGFENADIVFLTDGLCDCRRTIWQNSIRSRLPENSP